SRRSREALSRRDLTRERTGQLEAALLVQEERCLVRRKLQEPPVAFETAEPLVEQPAVGREGVAPERVAPEVLLPHTCHVHLRDRVGRVHEGTASAGDDVL